MSPFEKLTVQLTVVGLVLAALGFLTTIFAAEFRNAFIAAWSKCKQILPRRPIKARRVSVRLFSSLAAVAFVVLSAIVSMVLGLPDKAKMTSQVPASATTKTDDKAIAQQGQASRVIKGVRFVLVPAGEVSIGCTVDDDQCSRNELPLHRVSISKPLWVSATEITTAQFEMCVTERHCSSPSGEPLVQHDGVEKLPTTWVAAEDAQQFCRWLGGDLPSETEWEYAARGRLQNCRYPRGKSVSPQEARYRSGVPAGVAPVGSFPPNDYGLYDMAGNVAEFCLGAMSSTGKPFVIVRGGSYETGPDRLRVSARTLTDWGFAGAAIGFRCVVRAR